jgi:hypothetical protein
MQTGKTAARKKKAYLTKRALIRATVKATRSVASEAMKIKGYVVKVEKGWVVKIHDTGKREQISRIHPLNKLAFD